MLLLVLFVVVRRIAKLSNMGTCYEFKFRQVDVRVTYAVVSSQLPT